MENRKIVLATQAEFGFIILKQLAGTEFCPDLVIGKDLNIIDFCESNKINHQEKLVPGLPLIMAAYGKIITKEFLPCINVHPSLLPLYRGASPLQTAILNNEKQTGVTIMVTDEKMDHGPIIQQKKIDIDKKETLSSLTEKTALASVDLLIQAIKDWPHNKIKEQDHSKATFTKILKREDGHIDWNQEAEYIERMVRAFSPWPGTFTESQEGRLKILEAEVLPINNNGPFGPPGKVYIAPNNKIAVQTGKGFLIINKLQLAGKKPVTVQDFLLGNLDFIGRILQ
jgi:methionyl-tRNA formyltransferase